MKTVREWLEHLEKVTEINTIYGLQMKNGVECKFSNYKPIKEFKQESKPWFDYPVCYVEYKTGNAPYCLIQYKGD